MAAVDAGIKYIVITSKHHDGLAMYRPAASKYNIVDATPFKRDPLKELAEACARRGIRLGIYYSQAQDWHEQNGAGTTPFGAELGAIDGSKKDKDSIKITLPKEAPDKLDSVIVLETSAR